MPRQNEGNESGPLVEFENELKIDKNDLDNALIGQPDTFYRVSKEYALAISRRDDLKLAINEKVADLDQTIRASAAKANEKLTEGGIAKEIESTVAIIDLKRDYGRAAHRADQWLALKEAFQQRSYVLKDLASLWVAGYYTNSSASGARREAKGRQADEARETVSRVRGERRTQDAAS